ncbi:DUF7529 family protein [Halalkalicoccus tibetensis]|uniref:Uncharacterized protein n=1 Tax=Halalkalicoccus tibetensis TaxID=175632 RepID=A0ABD5V6Y1_9EURY
MNGDMGRPGTDGDGVRERSNAVKEAWVRTNDEMAEIADRRRDEGWDVVSMPAVHTSPVSRDQGDDDRFGLVYMLPDNHAEPFSEAFDRGEFPEYQVYRNETDGYVYLVTEFVDPESDTIILVAGQYDIRLAKGMIKSALAKGRVHSHFKTVDGTALGSVRHGNPDPFLPDVDRA